MSRKNHRLGLKPVTDAEFIKSLDDYHGLDALEVFSQNQQWAASSDPYYRDLTAALWAMFDRALKELRP